MANLRTDFSGYIFLGGVVYSGGDELPAGTRVSPDLLAPERAVAPEPVKAAPKRRVRKEATDVGNL